MLSGEDSRRDAVKAIMSSGQRVVAELERLDGGARFGRFGGARLLENGDVFERACVVAVNRGGTSGCRS